MRINRHPAALKTAQEILAMGSQLVNLIQAEEARRKAQAIASTWERYQAGYISHVTAKAHVIALWNQAHDKGLTQRVETQLASWMLAKWTGTPR